MNLFRQFKIMIFLFSISCFNIFCMEEQESHQSYERQIDVDDSNPVQTDSKTKCCQKICKHKVALISTVIVLALLIVLGIKFQEGKDQIIAEVQQAEGLGNDLKDLLKAIKKIFTNICIKYPDICE